MGIESVNGGTYTMFFLLENTGSIVNVLNSNTRVPFLRFTFLQGGTKWTKVPAYAGSVSHYVVQDVGLASQPLCSSKLKKHPKTPLPLSNPLDQTLK